MKSKKKLTALDKIILVINILCGLILLYNFFGIDTVTPSDFWVIGSVPNIFLILTVLLFLYWAVRLKIYVIISLLSILAGVDTLISGFPSHNGLDNYLENAFNRTKEVDYLGNKISLPDHPRILLLDKQEEVLKGYIAANDPNKIHKIIIDEADKMLALQTLESVKKGRSTLINSRDALRRLFYLSYAWRLTHQQKYFDKTQQELLAVATFDNWNPSHFLDAAEMTLGVSIAYDWIYNDLPVGYREIIKKAIITKGIEPSMDIRYNTWLYNDNNWNQVCNAAMIYGALAIYENDPKLSKKIINRSINSMKLSAKTYAPDGVYSEGYVYWLYGTTFNIMAIDALRKAFKTDYGMAKEPGFLKTAYYLENIISPTGKAFNYSDATTNSDLQPNAAMFWLADELKDPIVLWADRFASMHSTTKNIIPNRLLPAAILWNYGAGLKNAKAPENRIWVGNGENSIATMRTSWTDPNAIFIGLKAGSPSKNHGHMDVGSFVMEANGERWALDLGMDNYTKLESRSKDIWDMSQGSARWKILRYNNQSHNTLTINGDLQLATGSANIISHSADRAFISATTDLTAIYANSIAKAVRGVAIIDERYVAITDEIKSSGNKACTVKWSMVTAADIKIINNTTIQLTQNGKSLTIQIQQPLNTVIKTRPLNITSIEAKKTENFIIEFETIMQPNTIKSLTVLLIPNGSAKPTKQVLPLAKWPVN